MQRDDGFTLAEVIIALGVLGTAAVALVSLAMMTSRANTLSHHKAQAAELTAAAVEDVKAITLETLATPYNVTEVLTEGWPRNCQVSNVILEGTNSFEVRCATALDNGSVVTMTTYIANLGAHEGDNTEHAYVHAWNQTQ